MPGGWDESRSCERAKDYQGGRGGFNREREMAVHEVREHWRVLVLVARVDLVSRSLHLLSFATGL